MGVVWSSETFPEVTIVNTRLTVTITATFEIKDRGDADAAERDVEAAVGALNTGDVGVAYETEQVEG